MDDPLQWILQRRKGNPRKKNSGWQDRSFCRTREGLARCVRENCGEIDVDAYARLLALAEFHQGLARCVRENCGEIDVDAYARLLALAEFHLDWESCR